MRTEYIGYDALATAAVVIVAACAALAVVASAVKAWREALRPFSDMREMLAEHERRLARDHDRIGDLKKSNDLQMRALMQLVNHELDGNDREKLAEVRDEMQEYLISRR